MHNQLQTRRSKVQKLMNLAWTDKNLPKYYQARYLITEIDKREQSIHLFRTNFINRLKATA